MLSKILRNKAGNARNETEKELGRSILTNKNFLPEKSKN